MSENNCRVLVELYDYARKVGFLFCKVDDSDEIIEVSKRSCKLKKYKKGKPEPTFVLTGEAAQKLVNSLFLKGIKPFPKAEAEKENE